MGYKHHCLENWFRMWVLGSWAISVPSVTLGFPSPLVQSKCHGAELLACSLGQGQCMTSSLPVRLFLMFKSKKASKCTFSGNSVSISNTS